MGNPNQVLRRVSILSVAVVVGITLLLTAKAPTAAGQGGGQPGQLVITEVAVHTPEDGFLTIRGRNLDNGNDLVVMLGEIPDSLLVLTSTSNEIVAELPVSIEAADYQLTVVTGNGPSRRDVYDLTVPPAGSPGVVPVGAIILWDQSMECPEGYSNVSSYDGRFLVAGSQPGVLGGSDTHSHGVGSFEQLPHRHHMEPWTPPIKPIDDNSGGTDFNVVTSASVGGAMIGSSEEADSRPEFTTILLCRRT